MPDKEPAAKENGALEASRPALSDTAAPEARALAKRAKRAAARKRRKRLTAVFIAAIVLLAALAAVVVAGDVFLFRLLRETEARQAQASEHAGQTAAPTPTLISTPSPEPTPAPTQTPAPTRAPKAGDIAVNFPDYDTGADADYSYQSDEIRIAVRSYVQFPEAYFIADVWIRNLEAFKAVFSNDTFRSTYQPPLDIAAQNNALLAVNSDWNTGIVIRNGNLMRKSRIDGPLLVLYKDGRMETFSMSSRQDGDELLAAGAWNSWAFGPILIKNGEIPSNLATSGHAPRTTMGYYEPGHYCFMVADGRQQDYAAGLTMRDLAEILLELGCQEAFNLDGGQSSVMIFDGQTVNKPVKGGRALPNMIVISEGANPLAPAGD